MSRSLRFEGTPEAREIWRKVDKAAEGLPQWILDRLDQAFADAHPQPNEASHE